MQKPLRVIIIIVKTRIPWGERQRGGTTDCVPPLDIYVFPFKNTLPSPSAGSGGSYRRAAGGRVGRGTSVCYFSKMLYIFAK